MNQPLADVSVSQSFQNLLNTVFNAIPKILLFLVILVIGWIVARVIMQAVVMLLKKVKFDHFAERGVVGEALGRSPYDASSLIGKIVYYMLDDLELDERAKRGTFHDADPKPDATA